MARPATGWTEWRKDKDGTPRWHVWVTLTHGKGRHAIPLDPSIKQRETERAKECGAFTSKWYREHGVAPETGSETVGAWFKRLHAAKDAKGLATVKDMRGRASAWILPGIEHKAMAKVAAEDIEAIVRRLDAAVRAFQKGGPADGRLAPSTAANVWGDLAHAFEEAVRAKDPALRVLAVNPAANVRGPETGEDREAPILYSDEIVALLRGTADESDGKRHLDVPLYRRRAYALALYTAARASELEALTASDVDLARMTITVSKQADRTSKGRKGTKATKTKRARVVDVEPHLAPLVRLLVKHPEGKAGRLLRMPPPEDRAELLRRDLRTVGVTREALHIERDPLRRAITFHDLRDTALTHAAVRGDHPTVIQWRAGHTDYKMTSGYIDRGRVEARRIGEPLPPLPPEVLQAAHRGSAFCGSDGSETDANGSEATDSRDGSSETPSGAIAKRAEFSGDRAMLSADSIPVGVTP